MLSKLNAFTLISSSIEHEDTKCKDDIVHLDDVDKIESNTKKPSSSNNFYVGVIQMLEEAIRNKKKVKSLSKNNDKLEEFSGEKNLEAIQEERTNNIDSNINSQHSNNEEEICEEKHKNCFLNKDKCNDDLNDSKYNHLNSKISFLSSPSSTTCATATKKKDETLDILNTFDTGTSIFEKNLCNSNETEHKETVSNLPQVDKCPIRLFLLSIYRWLNMLRILFTKSNQFVKIFHFHSHYKVLD